MLSGWETPPGYPAGIQQKILSRSLDEQNKTSNRSRLLRFAPGVYTTQPFVHVYWGRSFSFPAIWSSATTRKAMVARASVS